MVHNIEGSRIKVMAQDSLSVRNVVRSTLRWIVYRIRVVGIILVEYRKRKWLGMLGRVFNKFMHC